VRSGIPIARWLLRMPSVDECRPARCPRCHCAVYASQGQVQLHGHGLRKRVLMCMESARAEPKRVVIQARRFLCRRCSATCLVVPSGVLAYRRYTGPSIGALIAREAEVMQQGYQRADGPRRPRTVRRWVRRTTVECLQRDSPDERLAWLGRLIGASVAHHVTGDLAEAAFLSALTCVDTEHSINVCIRPPHQLGAAAQSSYESFNNSRIQPKTLGPYTSCRRRVKLPCGTRSRDRHARRSRRRRRLERSSPQVC